MKIHLLFICLIFYLVSCSSHIDHQDSTIQNVVISSGTNMSAAVSPNGEEVVFDVLGRLWVMPISGGEAFPITDEYGNARQPAWSPDGQQITFQAYWEGNWHIYTIQKDGNQLTPITEGLYDHREPHWNPDGQSIIFSSDVSGSYDLWAFNMESKNLKQLTKASENEFAPAYSPDGLSIAYLSDNPEQKGIIIMDLETGEKQLVYKSLNKLQGVSWHPSGQSLTVNELSFGSSKLVKVDLDGDSEHLSTQEDVFPFRVSWLGENEYVYTANGKIQKAMIGGETKETVPFEITVALHRPSYTWKERSFDPAEGLPIKGLAWPDLSPNGKEVALVMLGDIWIVKEDGSTINLTNDAFLEISPVWSPNGQTIAYLSDRTGKFELWIKDTNDKNPKQLASISGAVSGISWSPDGEKIAISSSFGPRAGKVSYVEVSSGKTKDITPMMPSSIGAPTWSADGQQIAFDVLAPYSTLYREGINGVWRYDLNGNNLGRLEGLPHFSFGARGKNGPLWSPDGKYLAAIYGSKLWLIPLNDSGDVEQEPIQLTEELADNPSWSGNSKWILYIATDRLKKINIETKEVVDVPINQTRERVLPTKKLVIHAGSFFDGLEEEVRQDVDIFISGHRIEKIVPHNEDLYQQADEQIDASDKFVMPGLIDAHSHQGSWDGEKLGRAWLSWGVTTTRDPTSDPYDAINRKEGQEAGKLIGPTIYFTGGAIDGNRVYYAGTAPTQASDQVDLELNRAKLLDYDMVKTYVRLPDAVQKYVIEKAHEIGVPVSSHELYPAVASGVDGIEHILGTSRRGYSVKMSNMNIAYDDVTSLIGKSGISFTPTTGIYVAFNYILAQDTSVLSDIRLKQFVDPFFFVNATNGIQQVNNDPDNWKKMFQNALKMVKDVHEQGGLVIAGTDSPIIPFGFSLHIEMESYAKAGLSNFEVLQTATTQAAKALHLNNEMGSLETGKLADILILEKNPLEDIRHTRSVHTVIQNGRVYEMEDLIRQ